MLTIAYDCLRSVLGALRNQNFEKKREVSKKRDLIHDLHCEQEKIGIRHWLSHGIGIVDGTNKLETIENNPYKTYANKTYARLIVNRLASEAKR